MRFCFVAEPESESFSCSWFRSSSWSRDESVSLFKFWFRSGSWGWFSF